MTSATPPGSVPTFTLTGCATSQTAVAQTLERLRLIDGVSEVTLQSSTKARQRRRRLRRRRRLPGSEPVFTVHVTFDPLPSATRAASAASARQVVATPTQRHAHATSTGGSAR